ncbi:MAG: hypothetical protein EP346_09050 [Bacteroidetes bacterium]|nr:MAG: hypothetical protein EP346_09050 [Bacteroidota bacterium]
MDVLDQLESNEGYKKSNGILVFLCNLALPGSVQLYYQKYVQAAGFLGTFLVLSLIVMFGELGPILLYSCIGIMLSFSLFAAIVAVIQRTKTPIDAPNLLLWTLVAILLRFGIPYLASGFLISKTVTAPTASMAPTILPGELIRMENKEFKRGSVVMFERADLGTGDRDLSRVVGLPGEHIRFDYIDEFIDGKLADHSYEVFHTYVIESSQPDITFNSVKLQYEGQIYSRDGYQYVSQITDSTAQFISTQVGCDSIWERPFVTYELEESILNTTIPYKGMTVVINDSTAHIYAKLISLEQGYYTGSSRDDKLETTERYSAYTFQKDYVFVTSDNRGVAQDSRHYNCIPVEDIKSVATYIVVSDTNERIGKSLEN